MGTLINNLSPPELIHTSKRVECVKSIQYSNSSHRTSVFSRSEKTLALQFRYVYSFTETIVRYRPEKLNLCVHFVHYCVVIVTRYVRVPLGWEYCYCITMRTFLWDLILCLCEAFESIFVQLVDVVLKMFFACLFI